MKIVSQQDIRRLERRYEGITSLIDRYEGACIPPCPRCGSTDTAIVQLGFVGILNALAAATSKVTIVLNGPRPGKYMCRLCQTYHNDHAPWTRSQ